ncbi:endonuclease/exonuclease/phosphatase family protein, partial [Tanacetum coccineum]
MSSSSNKRKIGDDSGDVVDLGVSRGFKLRNKKVADVVTVDDDDDAFDVGGSRDIKSTDKALIGSEDIELRIRMKAIGDIIQLHSPNVICLQLSKFPVKSFGCKQFNYFAMGRELCIAEVSTQGDTPLVVATSHLEGPCPGPPKWDQMYSKERVKQANEAVDFLKKNPNAIFCGDMNWDDKLDGEFPLSDGWIDAWTELKHKDIGWTYDTKANPMLSANQKLQKCLDRFLIGVSGNTLRIIPIPL